MKDSTTHTPDVSAASAREAQANVARLDTKPDSGTEIGTSVETGTHVEVATETKTTGKTKAIETIDEARAGTAPVYRTYKARVFEILFSDPANALQLYNSINGTTYTDPSMLEINTLTNAIYMSMHNDVSFVIDSMMPLYEHQSTFNPNLPLRFLFYISDEYAQLTRNENLYGEKLIRIPAPQFVIFYNGIDDYPDIQELRLSDLYYDHTQKAGLELKATMLNINKGHNKELMEKCQILKDYSEFTALVRKYAKVLSLNQAVERAVDECIAKGILGDFLRKNKEEVCHMCIYEYDEERHMRQEREYFMEKGLAKGLEQGKMEGLAKGRAEGIMMGRAEGIAEGRVEGIAEGKAKGIVEGISEGMSEGIVNTLLNVLGLLDTVPSALQEKIKAVKDPELLTRWTLIASRASSIADFEKKIRE